MRRCLSARRTASLTTYGIYVESAWRKAGDKTPAGLAGSPRRRGWTVAGNLKDRNISRDRMPHAEPITCLLAWRSPARSSLCSLMHGLVFSRTFVSLARFERKSGPLLMNIRREGVAV